MEKLIKKEVRYVMTKIEELLIHHEDHHQLLKSSLNLLKKYY